MGCISVVRIDGEGVDAHHVESGAERRECIHIRGQGLQRGHIPHRKDDIGQSGGKSLDRPFPQLLRLQTAHCRKQFA